MKHKPKQQSSKPVEMDVVHPSYQPSRAELWQDLRVGATFAEAIKALVAPVAVRYVKSPKRDG